MDPDSLLQDGQKTILVSHFDIAHVHGLHCDRAFISSAPTKRQHERSPAVAPIAADCIENTVSCDTKMCNPEPCSLSHSCSRDGMCSCCASLYVLYVLFFVARRVEMVMRAMEMIDNRRWNESHVIVEKEASPGHMVGTRVAHVVGSAKSNWRERSRYHEESEWSLVTSLMCPFSLPQWYGEERSFKRIHRSCLS